MASVIPAWTCSFRRSRGETRVAGDEGYLSLVSDGQISGRKWLNGGGGAGREKREGGGGGGGGCVKEEEERAKMKFGNFQNYP